MTSETHVKVAGNHSTAKKCSIWKHCLALISLAWGLIVAGMHGKMEIIPQWWLKHTKGMTFLSWSLLPLILCFRPLVHLLPCLCHILPSIIIHVPLFIEWSWCTKRRNGLALYFDHQQTGYRPLNKSLLPLHLLLSSLEYEGLVDTSWLWLLIVDFGFVKIL